jgi:hypothetical protein
LGKAGYGKAAAGLRALLTDESPVNIYEQGELRHTTVAELAREALGCLKLLRKTAGSG